MTAQIDELIQTPDVSEVIRDQIAAILVTEIANQQALASAAQLDPDDWKLRVYLERSSPWNAYLDATDDTIDDSPIVNVALDRADYDPSASSTVEGQRATAVYHVDCYGYAVSANDASGHTAGDKRAAFEVQRAKRLVRNILMAGHYAYLGLTRGIVGRRWLTSEEYFQPVQDTNPVQRVQGARLTFTVLYTEGSPQVTGELLSQIYYVLKREGDEKTLAEYQRNI